MADKGSTTKAARLFDVRRVIGGLFVVYGVIIGAIGLFDTPSEIDKAEGLRINLWMGLGMLVFGLGMLLWLKLNPPKPVEAKEGAGEAPADRP